MSIPATHSRHHVVIIGGGFGGLSAATALRRSDVDVTVIDRTTHHLIQPLLCQVATGILPQRNIAQPLRDILQHQRNADVVLGDVVDIDLHARHVSVDSDGQHRQIAYDSLIVAAGSTQSYFGHPEFAHHAPGMKTLDQALELRDRIFGAFEMAEHEADPAVRRRWLTFVVIGAGPTGVELAGQLAELAGQLLPRTPGRDDRAESRIVLIDAGPTILPTFPEELRNRAAADLGAIGVELHVGTMVTGVDQDGIETNATDPRARRIDAATKIWAAGVEASPLGRVLGRTPGVELDQRGRVKVETDCSLPAYREVFVIGDLMSLDNLPGVSQVAVQSGRHAADTITRRLTGDNTSRPFRYRDAGSIATIARVRAIAVVGSRHIAGSPAWVLWLIVRLMTLTGFKNRGSVLFNWTMALAGRRRGRQPQPRERDARLAA